MCSTGARAGRSALSVHKPTHREIAQTLEGDEKRPGAATLQETILSYTGLAPSIALKGEKKGKRVPQESPRGEGSSRLHVRGEIKG